MLVFLCRSLKISNKYSVLEDCPTLCSLTQNSHHLFGIGVEESTVSHHEMGEEVMEVHRVATGHDQLKEAHVPDRLVIQLHTACSGTQKGEQCVLYCKLKYAG